ncbi:hypothetical protein B6D60_12125 [candidate division KSB1 bacterium 4484_87]|nr:MAG: hypothetical protein B6D60_12125 [candidate division KSB1 bacterium 4484_87]
MYLKKKYAMLMSAYIELNVYFNGWGEKEIADFLKKNRAFSDLSITELRFKLYSQPAQDLKTIIGIEKIRKLHLSYKTMAKGKIQPGRFFEKILKKGPVPIELLKDDFENKSR